MSRIDPNHCDPLAPTPRPVSNRSGLHSLQYRIGAHESLLRTMIARLSEISNPPANGVRREFAELQRLTAREADDPSIGLLDAWATIGDLLTFYQERLADETFLGTAKQRDSVELLARMIGFTPRPGLSSSVFLAFEVDEKSAEVIIPAGTPSKSTPLPGADLKPETFETASEFVARPQWNLIRPRQSRPHNFATDPNPSRLTFAGGGLAIRKNDLMAVEPRGLESVSVSNGGNGPADDLRKIHLRRVESVREFTDEDRNVFTEVKFVETESMDQLWQTVITLVDRFDADGLFNDAYLHDVLIASVAKLRTAPTSLIRDDELIEEELVGNALLTSLRTGANECTSWFADLAAIFSFDFADYVNVRNVYIGRHTTAAERLEVLKDVTLPVKTNESFATTLLAGKSAVWFEIDPSSKPKVPFLLFGGNRVQPMDDNNGKPLPLTTTAVDLCPKPDVKNRRLPPLLIDKLEVVVKATQGVTATTPAVVPITTTVNAAIKQAVKTVKVKADDDATNSGYVRLAFIGVNDATNEELPLGQAVFLTGTPSLFPDLVHERIIFSDPLTIEPEEGEDDPPADEANFKVDLQLTFRAEMTEATFTVVVRPAPTADVETVPGEKSEFKMTAKLSDIQMALASPIDFQLREDIATDLLVEVSDAGGAVVAYAIRTLVPRSIPQPNIRESFAEDLGELYVANPPDEAKKLETAKQNVLQLESIGKDAGNQPISKITALIAKSQSLLPQDHRVDLALDKADSNAASGMTSVRNDLKDELKSAMAKEPVRSSSWVRERGERLTAIAADAGKNLDQVIDEARTIVVLDPATNPFTLLHGKQGAVIELMRDILEELHGVRRGFVAALQSAVQENPINNPGPSGVIAEFDLLAKTALDAQDKAAKLEETPENVFEKWRDAKGSLRFFELDLKPDGGGGRIARLADFEQLVAEFERRNLRAVIQSWLSELRRRQPPGTLQADDRVLAPEDFLQLAEDPQQLENLSAPILAQLFGSFSSLGQQILAAIKPQAREQVLDKMRRYRFTKTPEPRVSIFRQQASLFGWNAPTDAPTISVEEPAKTTTIRPPDHLDPDLSLATERSNVMFLDGDHKQTVPDGVVAVSKLQGGLAQPYRVKESHKISRTDYGVSNKSTKLQFADTDHWWAPENVPAARIENVGSDVIEALNDEELPEAVATTLVKFQLSLDPPPTVKKLVDDEQWRVYDNRVAIRLDLRGAQTIEVLIEGRQLAAFANGDTLKIDLNAKKVPQEIDGELRALGMPLSSARKVVVEKANQYWRILDGTRAYPIRLYPPTDADPTDLRLYEFDGFGVLRDARVHCDAELLSLAPTLLDDDANEAIFSAVGAPQILELDDFYPFLTTQSFLLIRGASYNDDDEEAGESLRSELARVVGVQHRAQKIYGDRIHTLLTLARPLERSYWRNSMKIYANVVEATHGETIEEVVGSGDGAVANQKMRLNAAPLTRLPAANLRGEEGQLDLRVNNVLWGADRLSRITRDAEVYEIAQTSLGETTLQFGDGVQGRRLPTGDENVRAEYRTGLGSPGNVDANRIDQLPAPPLGVMGVSNPIHGSGGADADSLQQTRIRAGIAASRLGRLISESDYRGFALSFAGIDKAEARVEDGVIVVTVAGPQSEPLLREGLLLRNLAAAMREIGDPEVQFLVLPHRSLLIFVKANVRIDPRYEWENVEDRIRALLFAKFAYRKRDLNQDVLRSEVIATIQAAAGVVYVDVDRLSAVDEELSRNDANVGNLGRIALPLPQSGGGQRGQTRPVTIGPRPAEICFLDPKAPDTVILEQVQ